MTNKEAIEQLKQIPINPEASDEYIRTIYQAIDMAIKALEDRPDCTTCANKNSNYCFDCWCNFYVQEEVEND